MISDLLKAGRASPDGFSLEPLSQCVANGRE